MKSVVLVRADWCPVCPQVESLWQGLKESYDFHYKEIDISSKDGEALVEKHSIMSVPTTVIDDKVEFIGVPDRDEAVKSIA